MNPRQTRGQESILKASDHILIRGSSKLRKPWDRGIYKEHDSLRVKYSPTKAKSSLLFYTVNQMNEIRNTDAKLLIFNGGLSSLASGSQQIPRLLK